MEAISKGSLAGCLVHFKAWMPAVLPVWPNKTFKFPSMLVTGHYPAGFLMLVYLLEINSPLVALMPFWSLPYLPKNTNPITPHLHQVPRSRQHSRDVHRVQELNVNKREIHLVEFKYCEDTQPGHQYEASRKQHEVLCKRLKAKNSFPHTILLGVGGSIYNSHNVNHLKELGLDTHKAHKTALKSHAHSVLYAHKLTTTTSLLLLVVVVLDALLKNLVALKGLVWSRGQLVTLQILTRYSFSLVEETHFSLGQCVSFSLIDLGSGSTAYVVFLFFS